MDWGRRWVWINGGRREDGGTIGQNEDTHTWYPYFHTLIENKGHFFSASLRQHPFCVDWFHGKLGAEKTCKSANLSSRKQLRRISFLSFAKDKPYCGALVLAVPSAITGFFSIRLLDFLTIYVITLKQQVVSFLSKQTCYPTSCPTCCPTCWPTN